MKRIEIQIEKIEFSIEIIDDMLSDIQKRIDKYRGSGNYQVNKDEYMKYHLKKKRKELDERHTLSKSSWEEYKLTNQNY